LRVARIIFMRTIYDMRRMFTQEILALRPGREGGRKLPQRTVCYAYLEEGRDIDEIIDGIPSGRLKKKADQIKESIKSRQEISQVILIRGSLSLMRSIQERIDELDGRD
jgi:hypothetical protein